MSSYVFLLYPFGLAVVMGVASLIISFRAASYLGKHTGTKIDYWDVRFHGPAYLKKYRTLTVEENGKPGSLYSAWLITSRLFVLSMIALIITFIVLAFVV